MENRINIDFETIIAKIDEDIERANKNILKKDPNVQLEGINRTAGIAKAVCVSALQAYHQELSQALALQHHTSHE